MADEYKIAVMVGYVLAEDEGGVRAVLDGGYEIDAVDGDYRCRTALHRAADRGADAICSLLIERGANIEATDDQGLTPIHCAVEGQRASTVALLAAAGADLNAVNLQNETPLHIASMVGDRRVWNGLMEAGADPHFCTSEPDVTYLTPFQSAVQSNGGDFVQDCLERGVDLGQRTLAGKSLLQLAAGREDVRALLLAERSRVQISAAFDGTETPSTLPDEEEDLPSSPIGNVPSGDMAWDDDTPF